VKLKPVVERSRNDRLIVPFDFAQGTKDHRTGR
jgi:hypothetical protein